MIQVSSYGFKKSLDEQNQELINDRLNYIECFFLKVHIRLSDMTCLTPSIKQSIHFSEMKIPNERKM